MTRLATALLVPTLLCCGGGDEAPVDAAPTLADDGRVSYLLEPCARGYHYDVNTADVEGILLEMLLHGQRDPLQRARTELAAMGEPGVAILSRVVRDNWKDIDGKNHIRNSLDSATLSDDPAARLLLLEALEYPMEDVRMVAVRGLAKHGRAEDYEAVHSIMPGTSPTFVLELVNVLHTLAPTPAQELVLDWVEAGEMESFWPQVVPLLADAVDPGVVERCAALWPVLGPVSQPPLATACAAAGDEEALAQVRKWRDDPLDATLRRITLLSLARAEMFDELLPSLRADGSPENRILALGHLAATPERTRHYRDAIAAGLSDPAANVAQSCAETLARIADPAAIDRALAELDSDAAPQGPVRILRWAVEVDPSVGPRALEVLEQRLASESHRPVAQQVPLLAGIAQIPLERAAEVLLELSDEAEGTIQGQSAQRWLTVQAGNVGEAGHALLLERLRSEPAPARRIDYLEALAVRGGGAAREALIEYLLEDPASPYEILFIADRLVRIGPLARVAPVLKRVTLRVDQDDVRGALQCLLWTAYPGPR